MNHPLELWRGFPRDLLGFQKEMDRLFEGVLPPATQRLGVPTAPVMEAEETDAHFKVSFDVPGMK
ncbi:MAG: Hsp20/alpha crystallin family protein, partial [Bdellovibrionales bacterium]|nr:Hsp20/alpha crystallin family protein [Bdellovibrionales bacterium]